MENNSQQLENGSIENHVSEDHANYLRSFPTGFSFLPTDQELIIGYLQPKIYGIPLPPNLMHQIYIYNHHPEYLTENCLAQGENMWYFFTSRDKKCPNQKDSDDGYWKALGEDKPIKQDGLVIGFRKTSVFYRGKPLKYDKIVWILQEYKLNAPTRDENASTRLDDCILCRIYKKELTPNLTVEWRRKLLRRKLLSKTKRNCYGPSSLNNNVMATISGNGHNH